MMNGSPSFVTTEAEIQKFRRLGLSWTKVSKLMKVSTKTLRKWRNNNDYQVIARFISLHEFI